MSAPWAGRLQASGTTFQQLLDDTRRDVAQQLLRDTRIPVAQVAAALGYGTRPYSLGRSLAGPVGRPAAFRAELASDSPALDVTRFIGRIVPKSRSDVATVRMRRSLRSEMISASPRPSRRHLFRLFQEGIHVTHCTRSRAVGTAVLAVLTAASAMAATADVALDRTVLPVAEPKRPLYKRGGRAQRQAAAALRGQGAGRARRTSSSS